MAARCTRRCNARSRGTARGGARQHRQRREDVQTLETDILILGAGGAGLFAALHAKKANPDLDVTIAVKGLLGKCGCTRMVQGGYNVALSPGDSVERHFMDTIEGGGWLNDQDLAWLLVDDRAEAHPRTGDRARLLLRPQSRRHRASEGLRRADLRPHRAQRRSDRHRDHQPPGRAGLARATSSALEDHRALDLIRSADGSRARRRADARHAHGRAAAGAGARDAAGDRRRPDHVPLPHAVGRQVLRRPGDGAARRAAAARHGDGAVPSDRPARRRRHAHDRHRAGRRPARLRRLSHRRRRRALHVRLRPARRARDARHRQPLDHGPHPQGPRLAAWRRLYRDGPSRPRARATRVQGHGRALRRLRLRSRRRPRRGDPDRALHDGRRRVRRRLHDARCRGFTRPARIPAACMAPIGSAAMASPTRRCSAASPATSMGARTQARRRPARARQGRDRSCAASAPSRRSAARPAILPEMRERLYSIMWDDVGILRSADTLARGTAALDALARDIAALRRRRRRAAATI